MKVIFLVASTLFVSLAHTTPGDIITCITGGFFYNYMSYEESDDKILFSLAGQTLGSATFDRGEEVTVDSYSFSPRYAIYVGFDKNLCTNESVGEIPSITCTKSGAGNGVEFFIKRSYEQFDNSVQDVITRLRADEISANFVKDSGLTLKWKNGKFKEREDNHQELSGIFARTCSNIRLSPVEIPSALKTEMLKAKN